MKPILLITAALCMAASLHADSYRWIGSQSTATTVADNWEVLDGSSWTAASTVPGENDTVVFSSPEASNINLSIARETTYSGLSFERSNDTAVNLTILNSSILNITGTYSLVNNGTTNFVGVMRSAPATAGSINAGAVHLTNNGTGQAVFQFGYSAAQVVDSVNFENTIIEKNSSGRILFTLSTLNGGSLGLLRATGTASGNREISLVNGYAGDITFTVSGLVSDYSVLTATNAAIAPLRIMANSTSGSNVTLKVDVAEGQTYTASVALEATGADVLNLTKIGKGTQFLSTGATSYYSKGDVNVLEGTLLVNNGQAGKGLGTGSIYVASGAKLGLGNSDASVVALALDEGNSLHVASGGILQAGGGDRRFSLRTTSDIQMDDGSTLQFALGQNSEGGKMGNSIILDGATLTADNIIVELLVSDNTLEGQYTIVSGLVSDITGNWSVETNSADWEAVLSYDNGNVYADLTYIPEPASVAGLLGLLGLLYAARRRR